MLCQSSENLSSRIFPKQEPFYGHPDPIVPVEGDKENSLIQSISLLSSCFRISRHNSLPMDPPAPVTITDFTNFLVHQFRIEGISSLPDLQSSHLGEKEKSLVPELFDPKKAKSGSRFGVVSRFLGFLFFWHDFPREVQEDSLDVIILT